MGLSPSFYSRIAALAASADTVRSPGETALRIAVALMFFALALATRFWVDPYLPSGFPYLTFFPAIIVVGFLFGIKLGSLVALLSGISAWYFFIPPAYSFDINKATVIALLFYLFVVGVDLGLIHLMMSAYRAENQAKMDRERLAEQQDVLARELDHRLKNIFATMSAVISLSQKHAQTPQELADRLREKLGAMGRSNLLLRGLTGGDQATLDAVLLHALAPFGADEAGRLVTSGEPIPVNGQAIIALSLIFHELGTNAAKYGALSTADGTVNVKWSVQPGSDGHKLSIEWRESGGPAVAPATTTGFGSTLIRRISAGHGGTWQADFPPEGALIRLQLSLETIAPSS